MTQAATHSVIVHPTRPLRGALKVPGEPTMVPCSGCIGGQEENIRKVVSGGEAGTLEIEDR